MKQIDTILLVQDIHKSRQFYEGVLGLKIVHDWTNMVVFEGRLALHQADLLQPQELIAPHIGTKASSSVIVYLETGTLEADYARLVAQGIQPIHGIVHLPWQRIFRIRDVDGHIVEIGEATPTPAPKALIIVTSHHHGNTAKVAGALAEIFEVEVMAPQQVPMEELRDYTVIGLGSGIYGEQHHQGLLDFAGNLPPGNGKKTFLFSTSSGVGSYDKSHSPLRKILLSKGYAIAGEFSCPGHNTNSFLRWFGGINQGRPNAEDLLRTKEFAERMLAGLVGGQE